MGRYDFQSPGASATGAIQDFVKQRNVDERTALLDLLQKQDMLHGHGIQDANLALAKNRDTRDAATTDDALLQSFVNRLPENADLSTIDPKMAAKVRAGGMAKTVPGETPKVSTSANLAPPEGLDPAGLEAWAKSIEAGQATPENVTTDVGATSPTREVYAGGEKFRAEERGIGRVDDAIADPRINTDPDTLRSLLLSKATGADTPASIAGPAPSLQFVSPEGNPGAKIQGKRGTSFMEGNWHPSAYYSGGANGKPQFVGMDPETGKPIIMKGDGTFAVAPLTGADTIGAKPSVARAVSPGVVNKLYEAKRLLDKLTAEHDGSWTRQLIGGKKSSNLLAAEGAYNQALGDVFGALNVDPGMQQAVKMISSSPALKGKSVSELVSKGAIEVGNGPDQFTSVELSQLQQLLNYVSGPQGQ